MKFALPLADGRLADQFGYCREFALINVRDSQIRGKEIVATPRDAASLLPGWLYGLGADVIIAGGMGNEMQDRFREKNIVVVTGAPCETPEDLVQRYLDCTLVTSPNPCGC